MIMTLYGITLEVAEADISRYKRAGYVEVKEEDPVTPVEKVESVEPVEPIAPVIRKPGRPKK